MTNDDNYWFPAKRYGFGWGAPTGWQGWAVLATYFILVAVVIALRPEIGHGPFLLSLMGLSGALVGVCWLKGEPPRWRWGERD
ncbi:hypothetical protein [Roseateles chitosanitabidus]|uniref:hypothetical protein n=1 Tax=Roseateles chitosanitabidus TaxID=65048 RepID=UPI00082F291C|nr:hypothetical protein [Roseateles chitosanitabidus]MBO9687558.1 hypothetical protein [Roseateles chitosanitabidus]